MKPVGLRDPFRFSHYDSPEYQKLWPTAPDYLKVLKDGAAAGLADISIIETFRYQDAHGAGGDRGDRRRGPEGRPRRARHGVGPDHRERRRRQAARGLQGLGGRSPRPIANDGDGRHDRFRGGPQRAAPRDPGRASSGPPSSSCCSSACFPFLWSIVVSLQNVTGSNASGSFVGLANYAKVLSDPRLGWAIVGPSPSSRWRCRSSSSSACSWRCTSRPSGPASG